MSERGCVGGGCDDEVSTRRRLLAYGDRLGRDRRSKNCRWTINRDSRAEAERSGPVEGSELSEDVDGDRLRAVQPRSLHARAWIDNAQYGLRNHDGESCVIDLRAVVRGPSRREGESHCLGGSR